MTTESASVRVVDTIKKSDSDIWNYRGLELDNGMLCVLISHPTIDKAAAGLNVEIGSYADPNEVPGVAHFLKHMLFMGSTKYPDENAYSKFIESNGGYSNAYTTGRQTNYHFSINPTCLSDALDVFAQFFISPLFLSSSIDRELQAIHSEFERNLSQEYRRIRQVKKTTSDPEHPYSKFVTGNIESLRTTPTRLGIDLREVLLQFYEKQYSANRMSLVVLSNQSLDDLQSMVVRSFRHVLNKQLIAPRYPPDPFGETRCKTICYIVPIKEYHRLSMTWVIPDYQEVYYCNPVSYVSFLIHHEGVGSSLFHLKKLGLALEIECSSRTESAPGFQIFSIDIDLTIQGLECWQEIVYIIYQYVAMMRQEGPKKWIYHERKNMRMVNFQFYEKDSPDDFVCDLAGQLRDYPLAECLFGPYDMREFRPDLIQALLNDYLIPSRMRIFLISKNFTTIVTEKEKWYGTQYKQEYLSDEFIKKCETCVLNVDHHLPLPNDFIPNDFRLYHSEQGTALSRPQLPRKIQENEFYRLHYAEDAFYKLPKAFIYFHLRNPLANVDPVHTNISQLYVSLVNDSLSDYVYPARLGGVGYYLYASNYGIRLTINGYNQKVPILFDIIIERMIHLKIDSQRFEMLKTKKKQSLQNYRRQKPDTMSDDGLLYLTAACHWHNDELLSCLDDIKPQDIEVFIRQMFAYFYVDSLMYGNLTENQSIEYMKMFQQKFHQNHLFRPIYPSMWFNHRQLMLPEGGNYAYTMLNDGHCTEAITIYLQCFQQTLENSALIDFFAQLISEPCFDQLRTKEQLGYIVSAKIFGEYGAQGLQITVQSTFGLDHVNRRIERFLDSIRDYIEQMSEEDFQEQREGLIMKNMEIPKRMTSQGNTFWFEISRHEFCFDRPRLQSDKIKTLKREDIIGFYDHYISPRSPFRRKLAVYVKPSAVALANAPFENDINAQAPILEESNETRRNLILPEITWIDHVPMWKSQLPCYPMAQPYEKINVPILHHL